MFAPEMLAARLLLGCLFIMTGLSKLRNPSSFGDAITEYKLLSDRLSHVLAYILPLAELALGLCCLLGLLLPVVTMAIILLLLVFTAAVAINLIQGRRIRCHCFGGSSTQISPLVIGRNVALLAIAAFLLVTSTAAFSLNGVLVQWQTDRQLISTLNTAAPILACVALSLGLLFLASEVNLSFFGTKASRKKQ